MSAGRPGRLFVLAGPSGVGKGSIVRELLATDLDIELSVSCTTRSPRDGEVDGVDYRFVTPEEFQRLIDAGELLEWAEVFGRRYGTPAGPIQEATQAGRDVIVEIDVQGARQLRDRLGDEAVLIFIVPRDTAELERRLVQRGTDDEESIRRRLAVAPWEMAQEGWFDHRVVNDDLQRAAEQVAAIIQGRRDPRHREGLPT